ncbi:MAG: YCF48-related protein [Bacteroidota bacterium]
MKKIIIILVCTFAITVSSMAQNCNFLVDKTTKYINCGDSTQLSSSFYNTKILKGCIYYNVFYTNANTGYAVGYNGTIKKTTNAGSTWTTLTSGTTNALYSIYFTNDSTGYSVGDVGIILKTTNSGNTWSTLTSGTTETLQSVCFTNANTGYVVGSNGTIKKTTNAGNTWTPITSYTTSWLKSIDFVNLDTGYVTGANSILKTTDAGNTWLPSGSTHLTNVFFTTQNIGYGVYETSSTIYKTYDGGTTWTTLTSGTTDWLQSIFFTDVNTGYVVGYNGTIRKTTNAGGTWTALTSGTGQFLNSIYFTDANTGYIASKDGILKTTNAGSSWTKLTSGTTSSLSSIYFTDANTGYILGNYYNSTIFKTTDAGNSWTEIFSIPYDYSTTSHNLRSIYFKDSNTGYVTEDNGKIIKTTNAGLTWSQLTSGTSNILRSIYFTDANNGYMVGDSKTIIKTTNAGSTWSTITSFSAVIYDNLESVYFTNANTGYAVGNNGHIIKTTTAGLTWDVLTSGTTNPLWSIYFTDINTGYAVGSSGTILKTTNAGSTWTSLTSGTTQALTSIYFINANTGYVFGSAGTILKTIDAGLTWIALASGTTENFINVYFTNINTGYAVTGTNGAGFGSIYKLSDIDNATFSWQPIVGLNNPIISNPIAKANANTTYKVTITPNATTGCNIYIDSVKVIINNGITVDAGVNKNINCGDSVQLNAVPNINNSNYTYTWLPQIGVSNPNISNPKVSPNTTTTYIVSLNQNNGCNLLSIDSVKVIVNALTVDAGINMNVNCGDSVQLNAIPSFINGNYIYSWSPTNGISNSNIINPKVSPNTTTTFIVSLNPNNGCGIKVDSLKINVIPLTVYAGTNKIVCYGDTIVLNATGGNSYAWNNGVVQGIPFTPSNTTTYIVTLAYNGCTAKDSLIVTVNPVPTIPTIAQNGSLLMSSSVTNNQWFSNGNPIPSATSQFYNVTVSGFYQVQVANTYGCKSISTVTNVDLTGIEENVNNNLFKVYPNPAYSKINVEINTNLIGSIFTITDQIGKTVLSGKLNIETSTIELGDLSGGIYLLSIGNNVKQTFKVIKNK